MTTKTMIFTIMMMMMMTMLTGFSGGQMVAGGWSEANKTSPEVIDAAKRAVDLYRGHGQGRLLVVDVYNASEQIVSGIKYKLEVNVGISSCPIKERFHRICFMEETMDCTFEIVIQAWLHLSNGNLVSQNCSKPTSAWIRIQTTDKIIQDSVVAAIRQMAKNDNSQKVLVLKRISEAFKNSEKDIYRAKVEVAINQTQYTVAKGELYLNTSAPHALLDCTTDSPILLSRTRCRLEVYKKDDKN